MSNSKNNSGFNTWLKNHTYLVTCIAIGLSCFVLKFIFDPHSSPDGSWRKFAAIISKDLSYVFLIITIAILASRIRWLGNIIVVISVTMVFIMGVEMYYVLRYFSKGRTSESVVEIPENSPESKPSPSFSVSYHPYKFTEHDDQFGFMNRINDTITSVISMNQGNRFTVEYIHDAFGRRINRKDSKTKAEKHAIFIGCSATYGIHVHENKTLPAWFERMNPGYRSYNYGINGSAPNHYLSMLKELDIRSQVEEKEGILIYPFFQDHVHRVAGDYLRNAWNKESPYYYLDDGELKTYRNFVYGRPFRSLLYYFFRKSYFIKEINFNYPKSIENDHYRLIAEIISEMAKVYKEKFGNDNFFVFLLPGFETEIIPFLEDKDVKYINCLNCISNYWNGDYTFPIDNHPNGRAYELMAKKLSESLIEQNVIEGKSN